MNLAFFTFLFCFTFWLWRHEDLSKSLIKTQNTMIHGTSIQEEDYSIATGLSDYSLLFPSQSQMPLLSAAKKPSSSSNDSRRRLGRNTPTFLVRSCNGDLLLNWGDCVHRSQLSREQCRGGSCGCAGGWWGWGKRGQRLGDLGDGLGDLGNLGQLGGLGKL